jgi:hypothetical protein
MVQILLQLGGFLLKSHHDDDWNLHNAKPFIETFVDD